MIVVYRTDYYIYFEDTNDSRLPTIRGRSPTLLGIILADKDWSWFNRDDIKGLKPYALTSMDILDLLPVFNEMWDFLCKYPDSDGYHAVRRVHKYFTTYKGITL